MRHLDHTPRRIVSLQPSVTVTLRDLDRLDRVVACTRYCADVCPEIRERDPLIVSDSWTSQADEILAAKPDLVIASVPYQLESVAEILKAGIRFLGLAPHTLGDICGDIAVIAGMVGAEGRARILVEALRRTVHDFSEQSKCLATKPRVFCEEWGKPIIASQPWVAELVTAAGGEFIGAPGKTLSAEEIANSNPDVLIAAWCGAGNRVPLEKVVDQRAWQELAAVRNGRVFCINDELLNTPASNLIQGLRAIAWALHPELFPQVPGIRRINHAVL